MSHAAHGPKSCIDTICEATLLAIPNLSYFRHQPTYVRSGQRKEQTANNKDRSQWTKDLPPCHQTWSDDDSNMSHAAHGPKSCIDTICEATLLAIPNLSYFRHQPAFCLSQRPAHNGPRICRHATKLGQMMTATCHMLPMGPNHALILSVKQHCWPFQI